MGLAQSSSETTQKTSNMLFPNSVRLDTTSSVDMLVKATEQQSLFSFAYRSKFSIIIHLY
jgi:hypothetical protein